MTSIQLEKEIRNISGVEAVLIIDGYVTVSFSDELFPSRVRQAHELVLEWNKSARLLPPSIKNGYFILNWNLRATEDDPELMGLIVSDMARGMPDESEFENN